MITISWKGIFGEKKITGDRLVKWYSVMIWKKNPELKIIIFLRAKLYFLPPPDYLYFKKTYCNFIVSYKIRQIILYDKAAE